MLAKIKDLFQYRNVILHMEKLIAEDIKPHPVLDLDCEVPLFFFRRNFATSVLAGQPYNRRLSLKDIGALSASKGRYVMALDRLPETMHLGAQETYGPLDDSETTKLRKAVDREFPLRDGSIEVYEQTWDKLLVGRNSGASRRFSLLRRLNPELEINALITPYCLDNQWLRDVCSHRNFIGVEGSQWRIREVIDRLGTVAPAFQWMSLRHHIHLYPDEAAFMIIPTSIPNAPANVQSLLSELSNKFREHFNLGRYLSERFSQSKMRELISGSGR
jgi:hypothetical protein